MFGEDPTSALNQIGRTHGGWTTQFESDISITAVHSGRLIATMASSTRLRLSVSAIGPANSFTAYLTLTDKLLRPQPRN